MESAEFIVAMQAVELAGQYLVAEYARFQVIPDAPANISTEADRGSQEIILRHILKHFPDDSLSAEESTSALVRRASQGDRLWIVDPIDGTRGFAQKNGEFSIMVGFVRDGAIELGIVAQPAVRKLTYAQRHNGCWRRDGNSAPVRCQVTDVTQLDKSTLTQSRSRTGKGSRWQEALKPARVVETYSAGIKLALVARGEADIYLNTYEAFRDWDICAGHILVTEAGGKVTGTGGQALTYGGEGAWQKNGLLATNGAIHDAVLAMIVAG